ncbi:TPA: hypothetical protein ACH3X2_005762 [Trebouxia sp. C0005]|nr:MAG: nucleotide sugar transporter family [Trebouxia sp. A1-2]
MRSAGSRTVLQDLDGPSTSKKLLACLSYGTVSVSITLFNKAVFSVYGFHYPNFVTTLQIMVSILYMHLLKGVGLFHFAPLTSKGARQILPLVFCWWLYVVSGVTALRYLTVPMFSVFRRSTTLIVVVGEFFMFHKLPSKSCLGSIVVMLIGAIIAGATDLTYSLPGYIWVSICAISTAMYLLLIRALKDSTGLSESSLLYHNNVLSLPLMASYMLTATTEVQTVRQYPQLNNIWFLLFLGVSASQAFLLNLCIFRCTTINSPLATTITGQMKDIITTGLGMILFGDVQFSSKNLLGITLGLLGGMLYSFFGYMERQRQKQQQDKV